MLEKLINGTLQEEDYETLIENNTYDSKITEFYSKSTTVTEETVINYSVEVLGIKWEPIENGRP